MHERAALLHSVKGLEIVNERIKDPETGTDDSNIQAALIMCGIEVCTDMLLRFCHVPFYLQRLSIPRLRCYPWRWLRLLFQSPS
jgi:hypothetical protein